MDVVTGIGLGDGVAGHVPDDRGLDRDGEVVVEVEVEIETGLCAEVVHVLACGGVDIVVEPACTCGGFDVEGTEAAVVAAEEVEEVDSTVCADVLVVKCCFAGSVDHFPLGGVDGKTAFYTYCECGGYLLLDVHAPDAAHRAEECLALHGGGDTAVETDRPVVEELGLLNSLS